MIPHPRSEAGPLPGGPALDASASTRFDVVSSVTPARVPGQAPIIRGCGGQRVWDSKVSILRLLEWLDRKARARRAVDEALARLERRNDAATDDVRLRHLAVLDARDHLAGVGLLDPLTERALRDLWTGASTSGRSVR